MNLGHRSDNQASTPFMSNQESLPTLASEGRVDLARVVRKHIVFVVACLLATFFASVAFTLSQKKIYRADAMIRLDPDPPRPLGQRVELLTGSNGSYWNRREFYESEYRVIRSMKVATAVVSRLGLASDPRFTAGKPLTTVEAAEILVSRLTVSPVKDSSLVVLQFEDADPVRAQEILRGVVKAYLDQNMENNVTVSASAVEWLNVQVGDLRGKLEKSETALKDFREKNKVLSVSLEDGHNLLTAQLEQVAKDIAVLENRQSELAARDAELRKLNPAAPREAGAAELLASAVLSSLRASYNEQQGKIEELLAVADENNPKVAGARKRLDEIAAAITAEINSIKKAATGDYRRVSSQLSDAKKRQAELQKEAHELQALEVPYNQIHRTKANDEKIYSLVLERARETELTRMLNFNNIRVVDEASRPRSPFKPNVAVNLTLGAAAGLLIGVALAVLREVTDRSLKTPEEVETLLGVTCLGLIPQIREGHRSGVVPAAIADRDLIVAAMPDGGVAESTRVIRTNLTFSSPDKPYRSLVVTSAAPEEGKTTVACSLAIALAQGGHRVVLVDTDLRRPRLHRTFKVTNDVGVTMAIAGELPLVECIRPSPVDNLSLMTSGPMPPNPAELLESDRFRKLVKDLLEVYDRVVFDSPPILPVTDAAILSRIVDGTIVVARSFKTHKSAARTAIRHLRDVRAHIVGVILNEVDLGRHDYKEYHYHYRRDGYYSSRAEPPN